MSETAQSTLGEYGVQSALAPEGVGATAINGLTIGMTVALAWSSCCCCFSSGVSSLEGSPRKNGGFGQAASHCRWSRC